MDTEIKEQLDDFIHTEILDRERIYLQSILKALPVGVFIVDVNGGFITTNKIIDEIWRGKTPKADCVAEYNKFIGWWPCSGERIKEEEWPAARSIQGEVVTGEVIDIQRIDGTKGTILVSASPIKDNQGSIIGGFTVLQDITEQKEIERELYKHRERLQVLVAERTKELVESNKKLIEVLESITDGFFALDRDWKFSYINQHQFFPLNKTKRELLGNIIWDVFPKTIGTKMYIMYHKVMEERKTVQFEWKSKYTDDYFEVRVYPYEDGIAVLNKNITEKKKWEKEMKRLSGLDLIGQMSAGISHEIRNPMTTVRGFLQLLSNKEEYAKSKDIFNLMIDELDRANSIITEFLSMGKGQSLELKKESINTIVKQISPLIQSNAIMQNTSLHLDLNETPALLVNVSEIRQLLLNLCKNGLEAIEEGKSLTIKTYCDDGGDVVLTVIDQGKGIPPDILDKLGTPFFTTKDNGTGLGLGVCYGIAARHNATIDFETGKQGTSAVVRFKGN